MFNIYSVCTLISDKHDIFEVRLSHFNIDPSTVDEVTTYKTFRETC